MTDAASGFTRLLAAVGGGDAAAVDQLTPAVYEELRRLAKRHMAGQRRGHTLQTRDLIAEASCPQRRRTRAAEPSSPCHVTCPQAARWSCGRC